MAARSWSPAETAPRLVFDAATGQLLTVLPTTNAGTVNCAGFSFDGKRIITVDTGGTGCVQPGIRARQPRRPRC